MKHLIKLLTLHFQLSTQKGFTLVEVMVVLGIIGILASATLISLNPIAQINKSKDAKRKAELSEMKKALQLYYADNGKYPDDSDYKILPAGGTTPLNWGETWAPYIQLLPKDPKTTHTYIYISPDADNQTYLIYANLEQGANDPQTCNNGSGTSCPNAPSGNLCGAVCNYGVSSPNTSP